jgi:4-hydroxybenzoate polyprenyltransferase
VVLFGWLTGMGALYYAAVGIVAVVVVVEHAIVSPDDLSRVNAAFFTANGIASLLILVGVSLEVFL